MTHILVVDDDKHLRSALRRDLSRRGYAVTVAASAPEALMAASRGPVDVLVTDLRMADMDGLDLLAELQERHQAPPTILMSGYADSEDHKRAVDLGAVKVLSKPFPASELLATIEAALKPNTNVSSNPRYSSLIDALSALHSQRRSGVVFCEGLEFGQVHVCDGELVHATFADSEGEAALRSIIQASRGAARVTPAVHTPTTLRTPYHEIIYRVLEDLEYLDTQAL